MANVYNYWRSWESLQIVNKKNENSSYHTKLKKTSLTVSILVIFCLDRAVMAEGDVCTKEKLERVWKTIILNRDLFGGNMQNLIS